MRVCLCMPVCARPTVVLWRSEDNLSYQSSPSILFRAGSLCASWLHTPGWPTEELLEMFPFPQRSAGLTGMYHSAPIPALPSSGI